MISDRGHNAAMLRLVRDIGRANLIGTDIEDAHVWKVRRPFHQDSGEGYVLVLAISAHAIGKLGRDGHLALEELLPERDPEQS